MAFDIDAVVRMSWRRVCTPREASRLLEALCTAYRALDPDEQQGIKSFMSDLLDEKGQFCLNVDFVE